MLFKKKKKKARKKNQLGLKGIISLLWIVSIISYLEINGETAYFDQKQEKEWKKKISFDKDHAANGKSLDPVLVASK